MTREEVARDYPGRRRYRGWRARSLPNGALSTEERKAGRRHLELLKREGVDLDAERPRVRGDCAGGARPCPWVSCRHNLYLEASSGGIRLNFPDLEPEAVEPGKSCALDVADEGGGTLDDVGLVMNLTRERVRQIEAKALRRTLRSHGEILGEFAGEGALDPARRRTPTARGGMFKQRERADVEASDDSVTEDDGHVQRVSFFADQGSERADAAVCAAVWNMFVRSSNGNGFDARTRAQRAQSAALARRRAADNDVASTTPRKTTEDRQPQRDPMTTINEDTDITDRQRAVLDAHRALTQSGADFTLADLAKRAGFKGKSQASVVANVGGVLGGLRRRGLIEPRGATVSPSTADQPRPKKARAPEAPPKHLAPLPKVPAGPFGGALALLGSQRAALLGQIAKLDTAIEALKAAQ